MSIVAESPLPSLPYSTISSGNLYQYKCSACAKSFGSRGTLARHQDEVHVTGKQYQCHLCPHNTARRNNLFTHLKRMHGVGVQGPRQMQRQQQQQRRVLHQCQHCAYVDTSEDGLKEHVRLVHDTAAKATAEANPEVCPFCYTGFADGHDLASHVQEVHEAAAAAATEEEDYDDYDDDNELLLSPEAYLEAAMTEETTEAEEPAFLVNESDGEAEAEIIIQGESPDMTTGATTTAKAPKAPARHQCDLCPSVFRFAKGLQRHRQAVHLRSKTVSCPHCTHVSSRRDNLELHVRRVHLPQHQEPCRSKSQCGWPACAAVYSDKRDLQRHERKVHLGQSTPCPVCARPFFDQREMKRHQIRMHPLQMAEGKGREHEADDPEEGVDPLAGDLPPPPPPLPKPPVKFTCDLCQKDFASRQILQRHHVAIHERTKPFRCPYCDHASSRIDNLRDHVTRQHRRQLPGDSLAKRRPAKSAKSRSLGADSDQEQQLYKCALCAFVTTRSYRLRNHVREHLEGRFVEVPVAESDAVDDNGIESVATASKGEIHADDQGNEEIDPLGGDAVIAGADNWDL